MKNILNYIKKNITKYLKQNQEDLSPTSQSTLDTLKEASSEPMTNEEVKGTPFRIVGNHDKGYFVALGYHRLTETSQNKATLYEQISHYDWHFMTNVIAAIHSQMSAITTDLKSKTKQNGN